MARDAARRARGRRSGSAPRPSPRVRSAAAPAGGVRTGCQGSGDAESAMRCVPAFAGTVLRRLRRGLAVARVRFHASGRGPAALALALVSALPGAAQDAPLEYRVKAAYLFNFTKFVEWPAGAVSDGAPFPICVAGNNPFASALEDTIRGETVGGRSLQSRLAEGNEPCQVLFVPHDVDPAPHLKRTRTQPVLTVGESPDFLKQGGIINFVRDGSKVRFEISQDAANRAQLRISSRLLRLAREPVS